MKRRNTERLAEFIDICKKSNIKITPQRTIIYEVLAATDSHPSVDMVYQMVRKKMPNISFDTVNRTLKSFIEAGVAVTVEGTGEVKRFDAQLSRHQHFKCVKCRRIVDFHASEFDNIDRPAELDEKFKILRTAVYFEGLCDKCS